MPEVINSALLVKCLFVPGLVILNPKPQKSFYIGSTINFYGVFLKVSSKLCFELYYVVHGHNLSFVKYPEIIILTRCLSISPSYAV